jgi:ribosomal protein S18 acetylase RimI-like enzyme
VTIDVVSGPQLTVIVPFMLGCTLQWNGYVPAAVNIRPSEPALAMLGVAHEPSSSVAVCGAESPLVNVTVWPTAAWMAAGAKAKSLIATLTSPAAALSAQAGPAAAGALASTLDAAEAAVVGAAVAPPDEQAARIRTAPAARVTRGRLCIGASFGVDRLSPSYAASDVAVLAGYRVAMPIVIEPGTMRRLLMHEAQVHATPGRDLRDLGDAILLHDPGDPEPFWNRLAAIRWPAEPGAFDRRLTEILVLFSTLSRQPHVWPSPVHDTPRDLVARLTANGFRDMGAGTVMALADPGTVGPGEPAMPPGLTLERAVGLSGPPAEAVSGAIVEVLADAFDVVAEREPGVQTETLVSLSHRWFTHYLLRLDGRPAAVARRATFDNLTYLSSIGTASWARGRGFGRIVTAAAVRDALDAGSEWTYLGVFADNDVAIRLYERIGFARIGEPGPDLLLV